MNYHAADTLERLRMHLEADQSFEYEDSPQGLQSSEILQHLDELREQLEVVFEGAEASVGTRRTWKSGKVVKTSKGWEPADSSKGSKQADLFRSKPRFHKIRRAVSSLKSKLGLGPKDKEREDAEAKAKRDREFDSHLNRRAKDDFEHPTRSTGSSHPHRRSIHMRYRKPPSHIRQKSVPGQKDLFPGTKKSDADWG